ncbi:hypothetical protein CBS101457_003913 [Exobasidium rhododendri]|nr:hypothetical protein CBS101457_003913 [Exobasidium rhododendri]
MTDAGAATTGSSSHGVGREGPPPESKWTKRFNYGFSKSIVISDWAADKANAVSYKVGGERFWPKSNDFPIELEKCERILRAFTVEGIPHKDEKEEKVLDGKGNWITKKRKVLRKIPPSAIKNAKGVCIYSSMRSGIAPFGGGGGTGVVLARLKDGSWSAPSALTPQNMSAGLLFGIDFLDVVLLINSDKAMESFLSHKFTIGAETGLTAGPWGSGISAESGFERAPIYSYVRTRGAYAGVEIMGQVFLHRFDENERFYYWPGVTARDIMTGKVRMPPLVAPLHRALRDAELGVAQGGQLERVVYDVVKMPESEVMKMLGPGHGAKQKRFIAGTSKSTSAASTPVTSTPREVDSEEDVLITGLTEAHFDAKQEYDDDDDDDDEVVKEGEKLKLPPTPEELEMLEQAGIPDEEDLKFAQEERANVYKLPPPPMHSKVQKYWRIRPELAAKRPTHQLVMDGPHPPNVRTAQFTPLPLTPPSKEEHLRAIGRAQEEVEEEGEEAIWKSDEKKTLNPSTEEGVLLEGVDEEEADKVMQAAVEGEDVVKMKSTGDLDQMVIESKEERELREEYNAPKDSTTTLATPLDNHTDHGEIPLTDTESSEGNETTDRVDSVIPSRLQTADDVAQTGPAMQDLHLNEASSSSSPRASLNLSNSPVGGSNSNSPRPSVSEEAGGHLKTPPSRPPRTRPPPRRKV